MAALKVAIAGIGTVGTALVEILTGKTGEPMAPDFEVVAVSARSRSRDRGISLEPYAWFDDPVQMARETEADVFVELIGGEDGVAKAAVETALHSGKHVVTANKALLAKHGLALAALAEEEGLALRYEAAVAGGVPIIRALRDGLAPAAITDVKGVLNGTCNFMLAEMERGRSYAEALEEAQRLGFAEADPSFDVGGIDAAQKLGILSALAFGILPKLSDMDITGIDVLSGEDILAALDLGLVTKLVAEASRSADGVRYQVGPALVPQTDPLDIGAGSENIIIADAEPLGRIALSGPGAGGGATASAVAADLVTIGRGATGPVFARPASELKASAPAAAAKRCSFFIRAIVADHPGVLAELTKALAEKNISVLTIRQRSINENADAGDVEVIVTTDPASRDLAPALAQSLSDLAVVLRPVSVYPILEEVSTPS